MKYAIVFTLQKWCHHRFLFNSLITIRVKSAIGLACELPIGQPSTELFRRLRLAGMALRAWLCLSLLAISSLGSASARTAILNPTGLTKREHETWKSPAHAAQFSAMLYVTARLGCEDTQLPQALATPDPLFVSSAARTVKVSVIVGADGRVHTPLILESGGLIGDRNILQTVRTWRYRPATCNGVPTEAEGRIEFSRR